METPVGLMATAGISPRPTQGPGLDSVPKELKPRLQALMYPPPNEWCGLVEGLTSENRVIRHFANHSDIVVQTTSSPATWVSLVSIVGMLSAAVRAWMERALLCTPLVPITAIPATAHAKRMSASGNGRPLLHPILGQNSLLTSYASLALIQPSHTAAPTLSSAEHIFSIASPPPFFFHYPSSSLQITTSRPSDPPLRPLRIPFLMRKLPGLPVLPQGLQAPIRAQSDHFQHLAVQAMIMATTLAWLPLQSAV